MTAFLCSSSVENAGIDSLDLMDPGGVEGSEVTSNASVIIWGTDGEESAAGGTKALEDL